MRPSPDVRLYLVADPAGARDRPLDDLVAAAVAGGATLVQLRDKRPEARALLERARALAALLPPGVPLMVNDRVDVAAAAGLGVHLGQDDLPVADARRLLGEDAVIGLTVRSLEEAGAAPLELVDYVAIGGVFATASKRNPTPPIGLDGLRAIVRAIRERAAIPLVAIAGIHAGNAAEVITAGVDGIAVLGAVCGAPDPERAAAELRGVVDRAKAEVAR
jgi:thiamine-phosphate pyrophosphorylase